MEDETDGEILDDVESFLEWLDRSDRYLTEKKRNPTNWAIYLPDIDGEYDVLCESCGGDLPCPNCAE